MFVRLIAFFRGLARRRAINAELDEEMQFHIEQQIAANVQRGMSRADATRMARLEFGGLAQTREAVGDVRATWMDAGMSLWQDVRYGLRGLRNAPLFTLASLVILALGIGATTAIFSLVDAALLRPLPFHEAQQLVMLSERSTQTGRTTLVSPPDFLDWGAQNHTLAGLAASAGVGLTALPDETREVPDTVATQQVTDTFFDVLGVIPVAGRTFRPEDVTPDTSVVVISDRLWTRRFGADPTVVGRTIRLGSPARALTVVGIVPADFQILGATDVWTIFSASRYIDLRGTHMLTVVARLKPGTTIDQAQGDLQIVAANIERIAPATNHGWTATVEPLQQAIVGDELRTTSLVLSGIVLVVLLLACANVANLVLARGVGRTRELAVRAALGGSRWRIIRQLLTESLLLGSVGGTAGLAMSGAILRVAPSFIPVGMIPESIVLGVDWRLSAFAVVVTLITGLLFGLAPAWHGARVPLVEALNAGGRGASDRAGRLRQALVVIEIAAAFLLMTAAGLLLRTLLSLDRGDAGYHADHVVTMSVQVPIRRVTAQSALADYFQAIENEVRIVPGVRAAAFVSDVPLAGLTRSQTFDIVGAPASDPATRATAHYQIVTPGYFDTMGIPLLGGRALTSDDASTAPPVCVVNEAFAHRYFGTAGAIGAHLTVDTIELPPRHVTREIVGVIRQVKMRPDEAPDNALEIYVPLAQNAWSAATLVVRAATDPMRLMPSIQKAIARVDRTQVITRVRTMDDVAADSTARPRFRAQLVGTFAGLALVLAAAGIFSVLMFTVSQRSREFSVRIALGARTSDILRLVLGGALALTAIGVTTGAAAAAVTVRSLNSLLFGVTSLDPLTFTVAAVGVGVIGLAACVVPAIRALGSDPAVALRAQ